MKKRYKILLSVLVLVAVLRIFLPSILKARIIEAVNTTEGYACTISDVDVLLLRGIVRLDSFKIFVTENNVTMPFVSVPVAESRLEWSTLFYGKIVGRIVLTDAILNFADGETEAEKQIGGTDWTEPLIEMLPLIKLNTFKIKNGSVNFINSSAEPPIELKLSKIDLEITNISNARGNNGTLPSEIVLTSKVLEDGDLNVSGRMNAIKKIPDIDLGVEIKGVHLVKLRSFTKEYGNFDFEQGELALTSEIVIKDGELKGYLKPFFENVKVLKWKNESGGFFNKIWNGMVGGAFVITKNRWKGQNATRLVLKGDMRNPKVHPLQVILNAFRNAFLHAFEKSLEDSLEYSDVEND